MAQAAILVWACAAAQCRGKSCGCALPEMRGEAGEHISEPSALDALVRHRAPFERLGLRTIPPKSPESATVCPSRQFLEWRPFPRITVTPHWNAFVLATS